MLWQEMSNFWQEMSNFYWGAVLRWLYQKIFQTKGEKMNTRKLLVSVLMFVSVLLSACAPAALPPTTVPPTTVPPTAVPATDPAPARTTISSKLFKIPMSISYGPDWLPSTSTSEAVELLYHPVNLFLEFLVVDNVTLFVNGDPATHIPFPDDFAGYLKSNSYFSDVTPSAPVSLGGAKGYQVDAIGKSSSSDRTAFLSFDNWDFKEFVYLESQKYRFLYFQNISGKRLLVVIGSDYDVAGNPMPISQFDSLMPKVQEVLDTVTFNK